MQFRDGAHVYSADNKDVGRIERVVMDPATQEVTHVIVRQGLIFSEDKVIPVELFHSATSERAVLRKEIDNLQELPKFEETQYIPIEAEEDESSVGYLYWYPPVGLVPNYAPSLYGAPAYPVVSDPYYVRHTEQNIPEGTVALEEGAKVFGADGEHVGDIERVFVDPESDYATHVLISQGLLLKEKKVVPTSWFGTFKEGEIHLVVRHRLLDELPDYTEE